MDQREDERDGGPGELERALKPPTLDEIMRVQVDQAFADFLAGDYAAPLGMDAPRPAAPPAR